MSTRQKNLFIIFLVSTLILICCKDIINNDRKQDRTIYIAVVGEGTAGKEINSSKPHLFPLNREQGKAMWLGAKEALEKSPDLDNLRSRLKFLTYDDKALINDAQIIAKEIQNNTNVIAVIGHGISETTIAASPIYAKAGIPLLMPIATSPYVFYPVNKKSEKRSRFKNCFRLPPSDLHAQAPAVAYLALKEIESEKCLIVGDKSTGALGYSEPLWSEVLRLLYHIRLNSYMVDRDAQDFESLSKNIILDPPDLIIFCGYGSTAIKFINGLRSAYKKIPLEERPKIILTDGCFVPEINLSGFHVYLTFPAPPIEEFPDYSENALIIKNLVTELGVKQSYHVYGFDAVLLLGRAINEAEKEGSINRDQVRKILESMNNVKGAFLGYTFQDGENMHLRYYIYESHLGEDRSNCDFVFKKTITHDDIILYSSPVKKS